MLKTISLLALVLWLAVAVSGVAQADTFIHTERSLYRNIFVSQDDDIRCIRFNSEGSTVLSCFSLKNPDKLLFECNKMILGALYVRPNPRKILMIGLGGGTQAAVFSRLLPGAEIDVVEIDPAMVRVATQYFNFHPSSRVHVAIEDGRVFVKRAISRGEKYDLIILDAFDEKYIPPHMMTREFLSEVKNIMAPDGVLASNTHRTANRYDSESVTYQAVFGTFFNLNKYWKKTRVIIAKQDGLPARGVLLRNSRMLESRFNKFGVEGSWLLPMFSTDQDWDENARIYTDWFMPF